MATAPRVINSLKAGVVSLIGAMGELFEGLIILSVQAALCWEAPSGMGRAWCSRMVLGSPLLWELGALQGQHARQGWEESMQHFCCHALSS